MLLLLHSGCWGRATSTQNAKERAIERLPKPRTVAARLAQIRPLALAAAATRCCCFRSRMVSAEVVRSPTDKRDYDILRLRNGLVALLISDPEMPMVQPELSQVCDDESDDDRITDENEEGEDVAESGEDTDEDHEVQEAGPEDGEEHELSSRKKKRHIKKAAAALCVSAGSYLDPKDAQGLAHLLEHMLFMGSTKFPDENEYDDFLAKHGGSSNAYTELERTVFHFDVNHAHLRPALERFSQFFIAPLIKIDSLEREVQAIHSEFDQSAQDDRVRLEQLLFSTADPRHPFNRFPWGNEKSLTDAVKKCGDIRRELLNFYRQHYQAQRMTLVVLGGEPLKVLKEWVSDLFQDVPEGNSKPSTFSSAIRAWPAGKLYRVESVEDQHTLVLTWLLPCLDHEYLKKPQDYISHLIGHEGRGSLLKFLKAKNWAFDLSAGVDEGIERTSAGYLLTVDIELTVMGLSKIYEVIGHLYEYVRMLREQKPQEWVFEEIKAIMSLDFKFAEEENASDYTEKLSTNMHLYPVEHSIYGDYALEQWDPQLVDELLGHINPNNMRADLLTKSFDRNSSGVLNEPWFGVLYTVEDIPQQLLDGWSNPLPNPAFHLPAANIFIPRDFSIKQSADVHLLPSVLSEKPALKVWYKLDQTFERPKANVYVLITCKIDSARSEVLSQLYTMLLKDQLNDVFYMASVANVSSSISSSIYTVQIKVHGYNEKLRVLLEYISEVLKTFVVQDDRFQAMKEQLGQDYRNANLKPLTHSSSLRREILLDPCWSSDTKLECLSSLCLEDLNDFVPQLFSEAHFEALCHGNLSKQEASDMVAILVAPILTKQAENMKPKQLSMKLPVKASLLHSAYVANKLEENSAVEMYFQIERDSRDAVRHRALTELLEQISSEPFFNQLRTEEQLGYSVECGWRSTNGVVGFCFRIQSSRYHPKYLQKRIDAFIDRFEDKLKVMPDDEFEHFKSSLIAEKLEKDSCLSEETDRYWEHVLDQGYLFDESQLVASLLKDVTKKHFSSWFKDYIRAGGAKRRCLSIHIWGCKFKEEFHKNTHKKHKNKKQKKDAYTSIENISHFKDGAEFYG